MRQVSGLSFSVMWGSEAHEPIHGKFVVFDYLHSPTHTRNMVAAANGVGWVGHRGEVIPSSAFFFIFVVPSMRPQLTLE